MPSTELTCVVCSDTIHDNEFARPKLCTHRFHRKCLRRWINSKTDRPPTCPICRAVISRIVVETKGKTIEQDPDALDYYFRVKCHVCKGRDRKQLLMVCSGCDQCYHCYCVGHEKLPDEKTFLCFDCDPVDNVPPKRIAKPTDKTDCLRDTKEIKKHAAELHKKLMKNLRGASYRDMESRRRGEQQSGWVDFAAARLETEAPASDPPAPAPRAVEVTRPATTETTEDSTDAAKSEDGEAQQDADRPGPSTRSRTRRAAERQQNTQSTQTQTVLPVCRLDPGQLVQPPPPPPPREHTGQPAVTRTRRQARTVQATITTNTSSSTATGITSSMQPTESGPRLMIRRSLIRPPAPRLELDRTLSLSSTAVREIVDSLNAFPALGSELASGRTLTVRMRTTPPQEGGSSNPGLSITAASFVIPEMEGRLRFHQLLRLSRSRSSIRTVKQCMNDVLLELAEKTLILCDEMRESVLLKEGFTGTFDDLDDVEVIDLLERVILSTADYNGCGHVGAACVQKGAEVEDELGPGPSKRRKKSGGASH